MNSINIKEKDFINRIIKNGQESFFLDFKKEYSHLYRDKGKDPNKGAENKKIANKNIREFVKDMLGFLNELSTNDKYIIYGVDDFGKVWGIPEDLEIKEERIQDIIKEYITPQPNIQVIENYMYDDKRLIIFKIDKCNQQKIYSLTKNITIDDNNRDNLFVGDTFFRNGTKIDKITSTNALEILSKHENSMFTLLKPNYNFNIKKNKEILSFVKILDQIVDKNLLIASTNNNINFTIKFNELFDSIVSKGKFAYETDEEKNDFYKEIKVETIDGGIASLCKSIFYIAKIFYDISNDELFVTENINTRMILSTSKDKVDNNIYLKTKEKIDEINKLLNQYINFQHSYGNSYFFKITEVKFTEAIDKTYGNGDLKFTASEDIMKLFLEPLYSEEKPLDVALRELLQNSFDACRSKDYRNEESKNINVSFTFSDDTLTTILIKDNGIGMNLDDIRNNYLTVGKSSKSSDVNRGLIGRFGIGALANFLIGDNCTIETKKIGSDMAYSFNIEKKDFIADKLIGKVDNNINESFTKITIYIKDNLQKKYTKKKVIEELDIKNMILNDDLNLSFCFKENENKSEIIVPIITEKDLEYFRPIILDDLKHSSQATSIHLFDLVKAEDAIENLSKETNEKFEIIKNKNGRLLYNNQLGITRLKVPFGYSNITTNAKPLVSVKGNLTKEQGYIPELSRNSYSIESELAKQISIEIYKMGIPRIKEELSFLNENSKSPLSKIEELKNVAKQNNIILPEIYIENNMIQLFLNNTTINYKFYSNDISQDQLNSFIKTNDKYIKSNIASDKSAVATIIDDNKAIIISRRFFDRFLVNATSSLNGFRRTALKTVLDAIGLSELYSGNNMTERWSYLNRKEDIIIEKLDELDINGLIPLTNEGKVLLDQLPKNMELSNLIITENPRLRTPHEKFVEIYNKTN